MSLQSTSRPVRWQPLTGLAFVVLFVGGVVASSPPGSSASDAAWIANYTGHAHKAGHIVTGVCLVLAGLCLLAFITSIWTCIAAASRPAQLNPMPIVAAAVSAACMAVGGTLMGGAVSLVGSGFAANADVLRLCNNVGFAMVGLGGMVAAALSVASLSVQAHATGVFGTKMRTFGLVVAVVLLASVLFVPIVALLAWLVVVAIRWIRDPNLGLREQLATQTEPGLAAS